MLNATKRFHQNKLNMINFVTTILLLPCLGCDTSKQIKPVNLSTEDKHAKPSVKQSKTAIYEYVDNWNSRINKIIDTQSNEEIIQKIETKILTGLRINSISYDKNATDDLNSSNNKTSTLITTDGIYEAKFNNSEIFQYGMIVVSNNRVRTISLRYKGINLSQEDLYKMTQSQIMMNKNYDTEEDARGFVSKWAFGHSAWLVGLVGGLSTDTLENWDTKLKKSSNWTWQISDNQTNLQLSPILSTIRLDFE